ncbi:MAG TPA: adenylate/guanylate cyclase domain-containing protein [Spirochaetia bacterium]|nr:adenylate/guanylate cyclase domain-containing protein [Spirochaetia bacterium]
MSSQLQEADFKTGERRTATILFADMKDFTTLSESMDPEEMDGLMNDLFSTFEAIIRRHDGVVEKYIGDALVAVFGAATIHEDDPARAVNGALDFLDEIRHLNRRFKSRNMRLSFRMGIHTGLIATGKRGRFDVVTGYAMNVASRLEEAAAPDSIYVSSATRDKCADDFLFVDATKVEIRGSEEQVIAYSVTGRNTRPLTDSSVYVGREERLSELMRAYLRHDPADVGGFFITGEAGMGKTALVTRFIDRAQRLPQFDSAILFARAQRYRNLPFAAITDLIANYLGLNASDEEQHIVARIAAKLDVPPSSAEEFAALLTGNRSESAEVPIFVHLYGIAESILNRHDSSPYPSLLFIDNAGHVDGQSRDFFQYFLKNARRRPFFILADRTVLPTMAGLFRGLVSLQVPPLSREQAAEFVGALWPGTHDDATLQTILANAGGNPLFIREYVRYAREKRDVSSLPATIQTIFLASIDSYEPGVRDILKKLSVFVQSFTREDAIYIQRNTDGDPEIVDKAIPFLVGEGIIMQEGRVLQSRGEYAFKHDLFKKALYNSLLNFNKRILHRLVANRMREGGNPHTVRLIYHLTRAEEYEEAKSVLINAHDRSVNMDYLRYIDILLGKCGEDDYDTRIQYLFSKSAILFNNGNTEDADQILKEILRIAVEKKNVAYMASAYHLLTAYNMKSYSFQKAFFCGKKALSYYDRQEASAFRLASQANVIKIMSLTEILRNNLDESSRLIELLSEEKNAQYMNTIEARAERFLLTGEYRRAADILEFAIQKLGDAVDDHWLSVHALAVLANWHLCDFKRTKAAIRSLLSARSQHYSNISQFHAQLAVSCRYTEEETEVAANIQQAEFYAYQIHNDFDLIDALRSLAIALLILGDVDKASRIAQQGITIGLRHSAYYPTFSLLMALAEIHYSRGEFDNARFFLGEGAFAVELNPLLHNRDLMLYYYLKSRLGEDELRVDYLEAAYGFLEHEKAELETPQLIRNFLALRCYGEIEGETERLRTAR